MRKIPVGESYSLVDDDWYNELIAFNWKPLVTDVTTYAYCCLKGKVVFMHNMIKSPKSGFVVDHIDWNGLNNQSKNLREVTPSINSHHQRKIKLTKSKFKGVSLILGKYWIARISKDKKFYYLGTFRSEVEAALAYDEKATELYGKCANTNKSLNLL
jgi:hypothetical protein